MRSPSSRPCCGTRFLDASRHLLGPGRSPTSTISTHAIGTGAPHLMFAGHTDVVPPGDEAALALRSVRRPRSPTARVGPRRRRHEGRHRGRCSRRRWRYVETNGAATGLDRLPDHGRRGRPGRQRHGEAARMGAARAARRFDHCMLGEPTNPDALGDMIKIGRRGSLTGDIVGARHAGSRRLSASRRQSGAPT